MGASKAGGRTKNGGAANNASLHAVPPDMDAPTLQRRMAALGIPPLPPYLGVCRPPSNDGAEAAGGGGASGGAGGRSGSMSTSRSDTKDWRPKVGGVVIATLVSGSPKPTSEWEQTLVKV